MKDEVAGGVVVLVVKEVGPGEVGVQGVGKRANLAGIVAGTEAASAKAGPGLVGIVGEELALVGVDREKGVEVVDERLVAPGPQRWKIGDGHPEHGYVQGRLLVVEGVVMGRKGANRRLDPDHGF